MIQMYQDAYHFAPCCDFSYMQPDAWRIGHEDPPSYLSVMSNSKDVPAVIDCAIDSLYASLRDLSLKIHGAVRSHYQMDFPTEHLIQHIRSSCSKRGHEFILLLGQDFNDSTLD